MFDPIKRMICEDLKSQYEIYRKTEAYAGMVHVSILVIFLSCPRCPRHIHSSYPIVICSRYPRHIHR